MNTLTIRGLENGLGMRVGLGQVWIRVDEDAAALQDVVAWAVGDRSFRIPGFRWLDGRCDDPGLGETRSDQQRRQSDEQ